MTLFSILGSDRLSPTLYQPQLNPGKFIHFKSHAKLVKSSLFLLKVVIIKKINFFVCMNEYLFIACKSSA